MERGGDTCICHLLTWCMWCLQETTSWCQKTYFYSDQRTPCLPLQAPSGSGHSSREGLVTLRVSSNMLEGATGCATWEAGFTLAAFVLNNPALFQGRPLSWHDHARMQALAGHPLHVVWTVLHAVPCLPPSASRAALPRTRFGDWASGRVPDQGGAR